MGNLGANLWNLEESYGILFVESIGTNNFLMQLGEKSRYQDINPKLLVILYLLIDYYSKVSFSIHFYTYAY